MNDARNLHPFEISCAELKQRLENEADLFLLDCRESEEHAFVNIEGATLLPMSEIAQRVGELEPHRERDIVVYCHHGARSLRVTAWLQRQGFSSTKSLAGGIDLWAIEIDQTLARY